MASSGVHSRRRLCCCASKKVLEYLLEYFRLEKPNLAAALVSETVGFDEERLTAFDSLQSLSYFVAREDLPKGLVFWILSSNVSVKHEIDDNESLRDYNGIWTACRMNFLCWTRKKKRSGGVVLWCHFYPPPHISPPQRKPTTFTHRNSTFWTIQISSYPTVLHFIPSSRRLFGQDAYLDEILVGPSICSWADPSKNPRWRRGQPLETCPPSEFTTTTPAASARTKRGPVDHLL